MNLEVAVGGHRYRVRFDRAHDISIGLRFNAEQPSAFGLPPATARAVEGDGFIGDVSRGGSVNCQVLALVPHGNGTHTECHGHVTSNDVSVLDVLGETLIPATLVTIAPRVVRLEGRDFPQALLPLDRFERALSHARDGFLDALVVRTLPNDGRKATMSWSGTHPPYLEARAAQWLAERGVRHLLIDLPSADHETDPALPAHRAFWDGEAGRARTITELIYVDNAIPDGAYLLNLQVAPFHLDAAPSRPVLYPLEETEL